MEYENPSESVPKGIKEEAVFEELHSVEFSHERMTNDDAFFIKLILIILVVAPFLIAIALLPFLLLTNS